MSYSMRKLYIYSLVKVPYVRSPVLFLQLVWQSTHCLFRICCSRIFFFCQSITHPGWHGLYYHRRLGEKANCSSREISMQEFHSQKVASHHSCVQASCFHPEFDWRSLRLPVRAFQAGRSLDWLFWSQRCGQCHDFPCKLEGVCKVVCPNLFIFIAIGICLFYFFS